MFGKVKEWLIEQGVRMHLLERVAIIDEREECES